MGCTMRGHKAVEVIAYSGCWAFGTPDDETHGSDRYRRTSGGLDILTIKEPTNSGWSGCLDGQGTGYSGCSEYSTALWGNLTDTSFTLLLSNTAFNLAR